MPKEGTMRFVEKSGEIVAVCWGTFQGQPVCTMTSAVYLSVAIVTAGVLIGGYLLLNYLPKKYNLFGE